MSDHPNELPRLTNEEWWAIYGRSLEPQIIFTIMPGYFPMMPTRFTTPL